jgi:adenine-specific DNA-methyltransferase
MNVFPQRNQEAARAYYTPDPLVGALLRWAIRQSGDRMLNPSCGGGQLSVGHCTRVGIEQDGATAPAATEHAHWALVHMGDFVTWATETEVQFECAIGNPPFIRYPGCGKDAETDMIRSGREH